MSNENNKFMSVWEVALHTQSHPLFLFSLYTMRQRDSLAWLADEISADLARGDGASFKKANDKFWFWTLGAYEVARTMKQHKECFSSNIQERLPEIVKTLRKLRIPFAKQELPQKKRGAAAQPIYAEASIYGCDSDTLIFLVEGERLLSKEVIQSTMGFLDSIEYSDVLSQIPTASGPLTSHSEN